MIIDLSPFQKALIRAALERYQTDLHLESQKEDAAGDRLWINRDERKISLTEIQKSICIVFSSPEQRAAEISSLKNKGYEMIE